MCFEVQKVFEEEARRKPTNKIHDPFGEGNFKLLTAAIFKARFTLIAFCFSVTGAGNWAAKRTSRPGNSLALDGYFPVIRARAREALPASSGALSTSE